MTGGTCSIGPANANGWKEPKNVTIEAGRLSEHWRAAAVSTRHLRVVREPWVTWACPAAHQCPYCEFRGKPRLGASTLCVLRYVCWRTHTKQEPGNAARPTSVRWL